MADRFYAKDPVPIRDNKKLFIGIAALVVVVFLSLQIGLRVISGKPNTEESSSLVSDSERTVYNERDVVRGLQAFGKNAKESALNKLRNNKQKNTAPELEIKRENLGPVKILRREANEPKKEESFDQEKKVLGIPLGTQVMALLRTKIFSFNTENHAEAESIKDVYYLGKLVIPKGTKFFGTVSVLHSEDRVNVRFHTLRFPWGEERNISAVAHELDGSGGLVGKVNRRWFKRTFSILGKSVLSGLTLFTVPNRQDAFSARDQIQLTAASNLAQEGQRELNNLKIDKTITKNPGVVFKIIFLETV